MFFRIRHGLDIPLDGLPDQRIEPGRPVGSVALLGADYVGLEPKMLVQEGDRVQAGQPLFQHKRDPALLFTSPGTGRVTAIHRGARRVLKSVVVSLEGEESLTAEVDPGIAAGDLRQILLGSGLWAAFRTRPFSRVPHSDSTPRSIFVTAIDSRPLAADPALVVAEQAESFATGLDALTGLGPGPVYLCTSPGWSGPAGSDPRVQHAVFEGPHPAGLPGTHIHHLDPVGAGRVVWHIGYQDVIAVGHLVRTGRLSLSRVVAMGGNGFVRPRLVRTRLGANLIELAQDELRPAESGCAPPRLVSGSLLSGREAAGSETCLGRYDVQIGALMQPEPGRRLRWRRLFDGRFSFAGTFARSRRSQVRLPRAAFTTDRNGRATAMVPIDAFERLIPMDVLTQPLLKALLVGDTEQAQALGCLELDEEDLALCAFICPGKNDYAAVLRVNLDQIEREG